MSALNWTGDPDDDCRARTDDGYLAHCEDMGGGWCVVVARVVQGVIWQSAEQGCWPVGGAEARALAALIIDADRWRML